ncbi:MAG: hypothetical protein U1G05_06870 [Kiritimatiellia bacterium]
MDKPVLGILPGIWSRDTAGGLVCEGRQIRLPGNSPSRPTRRRPDSRRHAPAMSAGTPSRRCRFASCAAFASSSVSVRSAR